eukprot:scaffold20882_cov71-Phaeocystis_antarctica.AAC.5
MLAATARMLPVPISLFDRLREVSFFMYTISGAAAMRDVGTGRAGACVRQRDTCRTGEHGKEGREEGKPRHVEGARVRVASVEDDELGRLVLRVNLHAVR